MIGYNAEEINNLVKTLNDSYAKLGETMYTGWDTVSDTLGAEWIGPDEVSFETELASRMCTLYYSCRASVEGMISNVRTLGELWQQFQNQNIINGAQVHQVNFDIAAVQLADYKLEDKVKAKERSFTSSTKMGVVNGEQSATTINGAITSYVNAIGETVKAMYNQTSSATAFLGQAQSDAINAYLNGMASSFAQVTTQVSDLQTILAQLVKAYNDQMTQFTTQVSGLDTSVGVGSGAVAAGQSGMPQG